MNRHGGVCSWSCYPQSSCADAKERSGRSLYYRHPPKLPTIAPDVDCPVGAKALRLERIAKYRIISGPGFEGRRTELASDMSASRPIGFDLGYGAAELASVSHAVLVGVRLLNKPVSRPHLAWGIFLTSKLPLRPDEPARGRRCLWSF
jgi:hypothetical protein